MIYIGCHLSVSEGYRAMGERMLSWGGDTFAYFTRNPRGGKARKADMEDVSGLNSLLEKEHFGPLVAHASYTMNLCSSNARTRANAAAMIRGDLEHMELFPGNLYNFHPGCHVGQGLETGISMIADALNQVLSEDMHSVVLLETMAGKGTEIGGRFEELREIIDRVDLKDRMGVCFDTCHVWDAGYDIVQDLDGVLTQFDSIVGLDRLKAVHFNDSMNSCGAHKDRHERLGYGKIGSDAMRRVVRHPALAGRPFVLETPNDDRGYIEEIHTVLDWME